jgi:hypothetical protein
MEWFLKMPWPVSGTTCIVIYLYSVYLVLPDLIPVGIRLILGQLVSRWYHNWYRSGYLEMFIGEWRAISPHMWTWKDTQVACRKLFGLE